MPRSSTAPLLHWQYGSEVVRILNTFCDQTDKFVLQVGGTVSHQTIEDSEGSTQIDDGGGGVLGVGVKGCEEPLVVRIVIT